MIKEAINFIDKYNEYKLEPVNASRSNVDYTIDTINNSYPYIVIVNTEMIDGKPQYAGFTLLSLNGEQIFSTISVEEPKKWLREHLDILPNFKFNDYIYAMTQANKRIGTTSGLGTFSLFHFKLSAIFDSDNLYVPDKKIEAHKLSDKDSRFFSESDKLSKEEKTILALLHAKSDGVEEIASASNNKRIKRIGQILLDFLNEFLIVLQLKSTDFKKNKEDKESEKGEKFRKISDNLYIYLDFNYQDLPRKALATRLESCLFITPDTIEENSFCPICNTDKVKIGSPASYNSLGTQKKPFNVHLDKTNPYNIKLCIKCLEKLNDFEQYLKRTKIKFFPLFLKVEDQVEMIKYLKNPDLSFFDIVEHIYNLHENDKSSFDFILLHISNEILYYDYINNYQIHYREKYKSYFENFEYDYGPKYLKKHIEEKTFLGISSQYYFGSLRKMERHRKYLIYKYRTKIFDSIYRNKRSLTTEDIKEIVFTLIDSKIRRNEKVSGKNICTRFLDFYLNSPLFSHNCDKFITKNKEGEIMLETIRKEKQEILKGYQIEIDSDDRFGYYLGQLIYYLIQKSKTQNRMALLNPIISCQSTESLQRIVVEKYIEKYSRELSGYKDFKHLLIAAILGYLNSKFKSPFNNIKMPFYVGFFDDNIFFMKGVEKSE